MVLAVLVAAPVFANDYLLTVLILILYFAYTGQAWNILMGFAGQLSLGHALYVGLGAYTTAALYVHFGIGPWLGMPVAILISVACGAIIGFLAFRFGVAGVYFAILTIAFSEFTRIGFDHFDWVGGSSGLFLPVANYTRNDLINLRGQPVMFYYVILALTAAAFVMCHALLRSRVGYYWQAIREDELAARSLGINTFRYKMIAIIISSGMTAPAGVFYAFYYNNLFPEQTFFILRSIEIILGPIIGGIGTLFGPVIGAFLLTGLSEALQELLTDLRPRHAGRQARVLRRLPPAGGDGPAERHLAADRAAVAPRPARNAGGLRWPRSWRSTNVSKNFSGLRAVADVSFAVPEGCDLRGDRPERRRQDHAVQSDRRRVRAGRRHASRSRARASTGCRPTRCAAAASAAPSRSFVRFRRSASRTTSRSARCCATRTRRRRCAARIRSSGGSICSTSAGTWPGR